MTRRKALIAIPYLTPILFGFLALKAESPNGERGFFSALEPSWPGPPGSATPSWSADGEWIVFQSVREKGVKVYRVRPDGKDLQPIVDEEKARVGHPACSPRDDRVAVICDRSGTREIYTTTLEGGSLVSLTSDGIPKMWPAFSPDGKELLYIRESRSRGVAEGTELCVLNLASQTTRVVSSSPETLGWSTWSPKGDWIYTYSLVSGINQLFRVPATRGEPEFLTRGRRADYWSPALSPDGRWMSYTKSQRVNGDWGNNGDLYLRDVAGESRPRQLTSGLRHESGARFSPKGTSLCFLGQETGYWELYVLPLPDGPPRQITFPPELELTQIARAKGIDAAKKHYARFKHRGALFSETAMSFLLEALERDSDEHGDLLRIMLETYPESTKTSQGTPE